MQVRLYQLHISFTALRIDIKTRIQWSLWDGLKCVSERENGERSVSVPPILGRRRLRGRPPIGHLPSTHTRWKVEGGREVAT